TLKTVGADEAEVAKTLAEWLKEQPGILRAYTRAQLLQDLPADDRLGEQVRRSFHPDRCGDLFVVLKPNYLFAGSYWTGTTHGIPHAHDTHVPLLVYGPKVQGSPSAAEEPVTPQAIAAIFARALGIAPPSSAEAEVPNSLTILKK